MKKFLILLEGHGAGCDYTIGCNKNFYLKEAESFQSLLEQYFPDITDAALKDEDWILNINFHPNKYSKASFYEVGEEFDLLTAGMEYIRQYDAKIEELQDDLDEKAEREQYELLKRKFEK